MKFYRDSYTSQLWSRSTRSPVLAFNFSRGTTPQIVVQDVTDGVIQTPAGTYTLGFKTAKTDGSYLVAAVTGTLDTNAKTITFAPVFLSTALDTALGTSDSVTAYGELKIVGATYTDESGFICRIFANVNRGGESVPGVVVTGGEVYLSSVTALTGGVNGDLDAVATTTLAVGTLLRVIVSGVQSTWRVEAGTATTDTQNGIIRPTDYNSGTNAKNLVRVEGS